MKPVIFYVDDDPNNLTVFEAALPDDWQIHVFDNPGKALSMLDQLKPWIVVSDQRMPGMKGIEFLEVVKKILPHAVRIIVTGFSEEDLVVESVRKAEVSDYIRKPWDVDDLERSLLRAAQRYKDITEREALYEQIKRNSVELEEQTKKLAMIKNELEVANVREKDMRRELECWVPPFVLWALQQNDCRFPVQRDLVGITFDIIGSSRIHGLKIGGRPVRARILELFSEAIMRYGGWRESHAGDSAYAHFGLHESQLDPFEAGLSAAREFRVSLRGLSQQLDIPIECGVALHFAKSVTVDVHTVQLQTPRGFVTQKSFDTTSSDVDLLHRIEKLVHSLPGSNIIMTESFASRLRSEPKGMVRLGSVPIRGQGPAELVLIKSDLVSAEQLSEFVNGLVPKESDQAA